MNKTELRQLLHDLKLWLEEDCIGLHPFQAGRIALALEAAKAMIGGIPDDVFEKFQEWQKGLNENTDLF